MESITRKVERLVERNKTNCPFTIAQSLGIAVVFENLGNTLGYYSKNFRIKIIHINENTSDKQREFICSHELGHAILHPNAYTPFLKKNTLFSIDQIEVEANFFAVKLLLANKETEMIYINEAIEEYGVPPRVVNMFLERKFF
ncbi:ImmA/IrrE family metallo-endopeptidase [Metabacillus indicus]|uniref:ImmA/IrrE family metallo-endopeptidase n=1 Tax=Metabacillus indicus TaxID=246786 RepID=UPI00049305C4|nr:ImmA/IrrE family metallo-endopeptidase [Metabacillus indicus]